MVRLEVVRPGLVWGLTTSLGLVRAHLTPILTCMATDILTMRTRHTGTVVTPHTQGRQERQRLVLLLHLSPLLYTPG